MSTSPRISLRAVLGVSLLVSCFVLAVTMRDNARKKTQRESEQISTPHAAAPPSEPLSEASVLRIAKQGQAAVTLMRESSGSPWEMHHVGWRVDQAKVERLIELLSMRCATTREPARLKEGDSPPLVVAEVLVGQHSFALTELKRDVTYELSSAGRPCDQIGLFEAEHIGLSLEAWRDLRLIPIKGDQITSVSFVPLVPGEPGLVLERDESGTWHAPQAPDVELDEVQIMAMLDGLEHVRASRVEPLDREAQGLSQEPVQVFTVRGRGGEEVRLKLGGERALDPLGKDHERFVERAGHDGEVFILTKYSPRRFRQSLKDFAR